MTVSESEYGLGQMNLTVVKPTSLESVSAPVLVLHPCMKH